MKPTTDAKTRRNRLALILTGLALVTLCGLGLTDASSRGAATRRGQAEAAQYQGHQLNPLVFEAVTLPVLGTRWISRVDLTEHRGVQSTVIMGSLGPFDLRTAAGTLLIDPRGIVLMNTAAREGREPETQHAVRIPGPVPHPGAEIVRQPGKAPARAIGKSRVAQRHDLAAQLGRHALVGVEAEHPVGRRLPGSKVPLRSEAWPVALDHLRAEPGCNLARAVRRVRVDDQDLVAEVERRLLFSGGEGRSAGLAKKSGASSGKCC